LKVEWNFGDGTAETVGQKGSSCHEGPEEFPDPQCPHVQHVFTRPGTFTVTEKIYTDDLAGPSVITVSGHITVTGGALPTARAIGPVTVATNEVAKFDGSPSSDPAGPNQITEYHWTFGDGQTKPSTEATTPHQYSRPGAYTVSLTVTDKQGATSLPYTLPLPVTVTEPANNEPPGSQGALGGSAQAAGGVAGASEVAAQLARLRLTSTSLTATPAGALPVTLSCVVGVPTCAGTLTLRTFGASSGSHAEGKKPQASLLILARISFTVPTGSRKTIKLHLSASVRALLARARLLRGQITFLLRDSTGGAHITQTAVIVRAAAGRSPHRRH
jgi:PKD repeat protein